MKQVRTTIILSAFAALSLIAALSVYYLAPNEDDSQNELIGEVFYPEFTDPVQAASLKLIVWDGKNKETREFDVQKVRQKRTIDGQEKEVELWAIPDHENYPVENPERLRETAGSVMNIERLSLASNSREEHERLGVIDPNDENAKLKEPDQIGDRIILKDDSGNTVCDLIIGKAVDAEADEESGEENRELVKGERYYIRQPDQNETYVARLDLQITTEFSQWIDADLLQVGDASVSNIQFLNYEVENRMIEKFGGRVPVRENFEEFTVAKSGFNWSIDDLKSDTEELDSGPLNSLETQLKNLTILEVEPKPTYQDNDMKILNADLTVNAPEGMSQNEQIRIQQQILGPQGFIIGLEDEKKVRPTLLSTNGELKFGTDDGLIYHLVFGYDVKLEGKTFEFAANDQTDPEKSDENGEKKSDDPPAPSAGKSADGKEIRKGKIMSVHVQFDPELIQKPEMPVKPVPPEKPDLGLPIPEEKPGDPRKSDPGPGSPEKSEPEKSDGPAKAESGSSAGAKSQPPADPESEPASKGSDKTENSNKEEPAPAASSKQDPKTDQDGSSESRPSSPPPEKGKEAGEKTDQTSAALEFNAAIDSLPSDFSSVAWIEPQEKEESAAGTPRQEEKGEEKTDPAKEIQEDANKQSSEAGKPNEPATQEKNPMRPEPPGPDLPSVPPVSPDPNPPAGNPQEPDQPPLPMKTPAEIFEEKMQAYDAAMRQYEDDLAAYETQMEEYRKAMEEYEKKLADSRRKVAQLNSRFADWFYIVDAKDLEKVKLTRAAVVKPKSKADESQPPAGLPPGFNFPGGVPDLNNLPGRSPEDKEK